MTFEEIKRILIATLLISFPIAILCRFLYGFYKDKQMESEMYKKDNPIYNKLKRDEYLTKSEIFPYVENILTREQVFQLLKDYNRLDLFPQEFYTFEKASESNLANWLRFTSDLKKCPDEICLMQKVPIENIYYYVYKYRFKEWADAEGWMYGVVGAYFDSSKPYDEPESTFSRSSKIDRISSEEEALWVHTEIGF